MNGQKVRSRTDEISATATQLVADVPSGATTGFITVSNSGSPDATSAQPFTLASASAPSVSGFSPTSGATGQQVTISGSDFDATSPRSNVVFFNALRAEVDSLVATG